MRPVQSYGRVSKFQGTTGPGGSNLKGHVYSTPLPTAFVIQKVPIQPSDSVIECSSSLPSPGTHQPWIKGKLLQQERNTSLNRIKYSNCINSGTTSITKLWKIILLTKKSSPHFQTRTHRPMSFLSIKKSYVNYRTTTQKRRSIPTPKPPQVEVIPYFTQPKKKGNLSWSPVPWPYAKKKYQNQNGIQSDLSPPTSNTSFLASSNTFVVRPAQQFVSDSDPDYLETRYPDLFPFGRAGFSEERKIPISKKTLSLTTPISVHNNRVVAWNSESAEIYMVRRSFSRRFWQYFF